MYTDSFTNQWNEIFSSCSLALMELIITHEIDKLESLQKDIKSKENLEVVTNNDSFAELNDKMQKNVKIRIFRHAT